MGFATPVPDTEIQQGSEDPYATPASCIDLEPAQSYPPQSGKGTKSLVLSLTALFITGLTVLSGTFNVGFTVMLACMLALPAWFIGIRALIRRDRDPTRAWIGIAISSPFMIFLGWIVVNVIELTLMLNSILDE